MELFFKNSVSIVAVQRKFAYGKMVNKMDNWKIFKVKESGLTAGKNCSGRPKTVRTPAVLHRVSESVAEDQRTSTRKRCPQLGVSRRSL